MNKTYTETFAVRATDCDFERRMRLDALFVAMQEGGERHALALGAGYDQMMARGLFFALARIHVSTLRAPRQGETVVHTTWPGEMNRFFCPRYHVFSLEDGTPLAAAGALWVMLDSAASSARRRSISAFRITAICPRRSLCRRACPRSGAKRRRSSIARRSIPIAT